MKLPYDNDKFRILENGDERLVLPAMGVGNYSWQDYGDRWYRSLHTDSEGNIISCGFPKFMNLNEGSEEYQITAQDLFVWSTRGDAYSTLKMDGSLLIRYVHNGEVKWRTRGAFGVGIENAYEIEYFMEKYPVLKDPKFLPTSSMLFEWVSPENKIVISYDEPEIFLIGIVYHGETPTLDSWTITKATAYSNNLPVAESYYVENELEMQGFLDQMDRQDIEGFVIRSGEHLVKVKTDQYKTLHALKTKLTTSMLVDLYLQWDKPDFLEYKENFIAAYDFECFEWAQGAISNMYKGVGHATCAMAHLINFVFDNENLSRKEFALKAQQAYNGVKLSTAFALLDGQTISDEAWKKLILQNCKQVEMSFLQG